MNGDGRLAKRMAECVEGEPTLEQLRNLLDEIHANTVKESENRASWTIISVMLAILAAVFFDMYRQEPRDIT
jgi:hypothetical protein